MLIVTAGHGAFEPRKLEIEDIDDWEGRGLHYFVRRKESSATRPASSSAAAIPRSTGRSASRTPRSLPITLVHRRDRFRALETTVKEARELEEQGAVRICSPAEVRGVRGDGEIEAVTLEDTTTGETFEVECDALITLLGFHSHLGSIADWGLELHGKQIQVDPPTMETSLPSVYAAGDVAGYEEEDHPHLVGFGEAAIAANQAVAKIRGEKVQPKYSTD